MDSSRDDGRIESYLTAVDASMGKVSKERREALLLELREHVDKLVEDYEAAGKSTADAVDGALSMMGAARKVGRQYARMWYRSTEPGSVLAAVGIMTIASSLVSSLINPILSHLVSWAGAAVGAILSVVLYAFTRSIGAILAGWYAPRGATKAAWIEVALSVASSILMWATIPHTALVQNRQPIIIIALSSLFGVVAAVSTVRYRMRKFAGV